MADYRRCRKTGKRQYDTYLDAVNAMLDAPNERADIAYKCASCNRWHRSKAHTVVRHRKPGR